MLAFVIAGSADKFFAVDVSGITKYTFATMGAFSFLSRKYWSVTTVFIPMLVTRIAERFAVFS